MPAPDAADRRLAAAALKKQAAGQKPSREEARALARVEKARDEELRERHYRTIPKKAWSEWSGRQQKVLNEQAVRYGIPVGGREIELPAVVRWLHDHLAKGGRTETPALERHRAAKARREELRLQFETGQLLDRQKVHTALGRLAQLLRAAGETLLRNHGEPAQKILADALRNAQREIDRLFADGTGDR